MERSSEFESLSPLPYQLAIAEFLEKEHAALWQWFASEDVRQQASEAVRFDLLKTTYRIEPAEQTTLYEIGEAVKNDMSLDLPLVFYQAQDPTGLNASLAYVADEAHIVLHGPVAERLDVPQLRALCGHELSHLALWRRWDRRFLIADQILAAMTHDPQAEPTHYESARLMALYTEIFCDRGAIVAAGDPLAAVAMLVKMQTLVEQVSPESYLRQAEEIFDLASPAAEGPTHPDGFIRARAIRLWADADSGADSGADFGADEKIAQMIEGSLTLDRLDLLGQRKVQGLTRRLIGAMMQFEWMQTPANRASARMYFDDFEFSSSAEEDQSLCVDLATTDEKLRDYYCYVLLDFVTADSTLEDVPLAAALVLAERLGFEPLLMEIARRELRLRKKQIEDLAQNKEKILATAQQTTAGP